MTLKLSNKTARHLVLHLQGLTHPPHKVFSENGLTELIEQLGFVQLDSIRWVERAHHMTLFARNQTYRQTQLENLHEKQSALFENWTHDASLIPSQYWPYWKHKFSREEDRMRKRFTRWQGEGFEKETGALLERVRRDGELRARDLEKPKNVKQEMWQWHDGKAALEFMWHCGILCVPRREGFQKVYDLAERVIPESHFSNTVTHEEFIDWACRSALDRLGFGTARDIARYWDLLSIKEVQAWLEDHVSQETLTISVAPHDKSKPKEFYARPDIEEVISSLQKIPERMRALSPFDPVIRDRKRLSWLFGFDYTIEIYVPAEKRKYGYYVFPLLEKDRLIGRIDMQAKRADDCLCVKQVWLEKGVRWSKARDDRLFSELSRQARLCDVSEIDWDQSRIVSCH